MRTVLAISKFVSDHKRTTCRYKAKASTSYMSKEIVSWELDALAETATWRFDAAAVK